MTLPNVWDWSLWGTWKDPIHKSDLNNIVGKFGCTEQFRRKKDERAGGIKLPDKPSGKALCGNATHAVIARILRSKAACDALLTRKSCISESSLERAFTEEYERERAGRVVEWYKEGNPDKIKKEQIQMLSGLVADLPNHVGKVHLVEAGFVLQLDGVWLTGMTDLVYSPPGSDSLALADWKTGAAKPHPIELDHGWEGGIYSAAIRDAEFIPGENVTAPPGMAHRDAMEAVCIRIAGEWQRYIDTGDNRAELNSLCEVYGAEHFGCFPDEIRNVHLRDYIPYSRASSKLLTRPEDLKWAGLAKPETVKFAKGDLRGPAWLPVARSESDIPRLRHLLHAVVKWVRGGDFVPAPGEMCSRCKFREPCLNDGYHTVGDERKRLELAIDGLDGFDGFDVD